MERFERPDLARKRDLHELVAVGIDAALPPLREAIDRDDHDAVAEFAEQLADAAEAIGQRAIR